MPSPSTSIDWHIHIATVAILHFCLYFIKTTAFVVPGLTISKVYGNTMLIILNNRIASRRLRTDESVNLEVPNTSRAGGSSIIVTTDRLIFRLDSTMDRPPVPSLSDGDARSTKESASNSNLFHVSSVLAIKFS
jgi:hypothetical protein